MKNKLITGLGCALALGLAATTAHAQQTADPAMPPPPPGADGGPHGDHPHGGRGFDMMDTNHDGFVSLDEWKAAGRREDRFAMIDIDHNGRISREEMRAFMEKMRAEHPRGPGGGYGGGDNGGGGMPPPPQE